jgi:hypothetical protein
MYILTIAGQEDEGAYAVSDEHGDKTLYFFQDEDDAERFRGLLEADDFPEMSVVEVDPELAIKTCDQYNYNYAVITPNDFVIPPRDYDYLQDTEMA